MSHEQHDHGADHDHDGHGHHHAPTDFGGAFALGIAIQLGFVIAEVVVGLIANSVAVLADAGHNTSDVLALALAWGANRLAKRGASKGRTFGFKSASIMAALANALTLVFVNGAVAWEAFGRFRSPEPVGAFAMIAVSLAGVAANGFCARLFAKGNRSDVNVRAAFLHLLSDAAVAAGVALTGVIIHFTGLLWLDPAASIVVSAVVLVSTWSLLRQAIDLAMHAVPRGIDEEAVRARLAEYPGVIAVHDLHVWAMSTTENVVTAHVVVREMPVGALACEIDAALRKEFSVHHVTIQIDPENSDCALADEQAI